MFDLLVLAVMVRLRLSGGRRSVAYSLVAASSATILVLVFARVAVLTGALDRAFLAVIRAVSRQQALTNAAVAMVTAGDTQVTADAAVLAAVVSAGLGSWALFVSCDATGPWIAATAGTDAREALDAEIDSLLDRDEPLTRPIPCSARTSKQRRTYASSRP